MVSHRELRTKILGQLVILEPEVLKFNSQFDVRIRPALWHTNPFATLIVIINIKGIGGPFSAPTFPTGESNGQLATTGSYIHY